MRLLVLNYEYPPLGGGAGNATYFLCREWGKMGHVVDVVTTWFSGLDEVTREPHNVTVHRVRSMRKKAEQSNPVEMLSYARKGRIKALSLCKEHHFDLTVSFFSVPSGFIALDIFKKEKIPYTVLLRGGDVPGFLPKQLWLLHRLTMPWTKKIWKSALRVVANSKGLAALAQKTGDTVDVHVDSVPNGVDTEFFRPPKSPAPGVFTFLYAGRFSKQKNIPLLLGQFEPIAGTGKAKLVIAGDGPEKPVLEKMLGSSGTLPSAVRLLPWKSKEDLRALYQAAHCFVNPSSDEGLPNTLLEAMACGLPVVASDIGGNNEMVEHGKNGYLFNLRAPSDLGKLLQEIMAMSDITSMRERSRNIVEKTCSWSSAAAMLVPPAAGG